MPVKINSSDLNVNQVFNIKDCLQSIGVKELTNNIYEVPNFKRKRKDLKNQKIPAF